MNPIALAKEQLIESGKVCYELFKVMIPVIIAVKILREAGLIEMLAAPLEPVMSLVGLPAEMGLAWAFALINNIYTGLIIFITLLPDVPMTAAQATVLGTMMLVAHALPVEVAIARKTGPRVLFQTLARFLGAMLLGWLLMTLYTATDTLQQSANVLLSPATEGPEPTLAQWALGELKNLGSIYLIILVLLSVMRILQKIGVIELLNRLLRPVLSLLGIGHRASAITVVGLTLGLSYGGGLIIRESSSGRVDRKDVFYSLTLMGLCHSLIEDTLLIAMMGGHLSGILWGRLLFAMLCVALLVRLTRLLPASFCEKYLWGPAHGQSKASDN